MGGSWPSPLMRGRAECCRGRGGRRPRRWWRRAHRLEPAPETAPIVKWIFAQRLARHSVARIARALNDAGVPCPSAADPERNAHRSGRGWTQTTVRSILANPRYTGRQVWNRQPTAHDLIDPANTGLGHRQVQRWNLPDGWVISARPSHPALISETDFVAVQNICALRGSPDPDRCYRLAGLLRCGICGRRMESCWANNRAAYRCRHGHTSASKADPERPKNLYIREDRILVHLPALYILVAKPDPANAPTSAEDVIGHLRAEKITLTYDPETRSLGADSREGVKITIDRTH
ncbi:MAG: recombinase family protein [Actinoallomurus sp.]